MKQAKRKVCFRKKNSLKITKKKRGRKRQTIHNTIKLYFTKKNQNTNSNGNNEEYNNKNKQHGRKNDH